MDLYFWLLMDSDFQMQYHNDLDLSNFISYFSLFTQYPLEPIFLFLSVILDVYAPIDQQDLLTIISDFGMFDMVNLSCLFLL